MPTSRRSPESPTAQLLERALSVTPHGSQTLSKSYRMQAHGSPAVPLFVESAEGPWVTDVEGRRFLDYPMSLGPIVLGHNHPKVNDAIQEQLSKGILFSLPSPLEVEVAEALTRTVPSAESVKFLKTGSEACSAAVRIARAWTGRDAVAVGGFHGWHDFYAGVTSRSAGVPQAIRNLTFPFRFNDIDSLRELLDRHGSEIAAVMLEPATETPPAPGYLEAVAEATRSNGSLLVFDEVITGFRWSEGGAQQRYGVFPDLTVLGKALGNGMPIAAVCGSRDLMSRCEDLFISGTYGGECLSLAAARAVLRVLEDEEVVDYIWDQGARLAEGIGRAIGERRLDGAIVCTGAPPRVVVKFPLDRATDRSESAQVRSQTGENAVLKSVFQQEMAKREILFNGSFFVSYAHTDADIDLTISAVEESLEVIGEAIESGEPERFLEGPPLAPVF